MKVFLTGGSGYIGSAVALRLKKAGHDVLALVRSEEKGAALKAAGIKLVVGELGKPAGYAAAAYGVAAIVHVAQEQSAEAVELDKKTIANARELLHGKVGGTFVYTSGCWVHGDTEGAADESAPLNPAQMVAWRPAHEQLALGMAKDGIRAVVVRPGIVYGGARGGIPATFFGTAQKQGAATLFGEGANHWPMVHVDDLAELYVRLVERAPAGSIFNAVDASEHTQREIAEAASRAAGKDGKVLATPVDAGNLFGEALALDQRLSSEKARSELDWRPRHESFVAEAPVLFQQWHAAQ